MLIANEKLNTNIAEYILYMWQIEDIIRASKFNLKEIEKRIIDRHDSSDEVKQEIKSWYKGLIDEMIAKKIQDKGHISSINAILIELLDLHKKLLADPEKVNYNEAYKNAQPNINEFRTKSITNNDIEACFIGLYAMLLLRLQKKEISEPTTKAVTTFSVLISELTVEYHKQ